MDDLLSEKEQIEQMRAWWSEHGNYVLSGVALGAIILFGINYVQTSRLEASYAASTLYDELTNLVVDGDVDAAENIVTQLVSDHADSHYTAQAALGMARLYMDENRDQDAAEILGELVENNLSREFTQVGRVRLAKILLYQDKASEVVEMLEGQEDGAFAARYAEILGDAYFALDRAADARAAYQRALAETGGGATVDQRFVQLKLLDLPVDTFAGPSELNVDAEEQPETDVQPELQPDAQPDTAETESQDAVEATADGEAE